MVRVSPVVVLAMAPARLVWDYDGREEALHGEQCAFAGDTVIDDDLGELVAIRIDGGEVGPAKQVLAQPGPTPP